MYIIFYGKTYVQMDGWIDGWQLLLSGFALLTPAQMKDLFFWTEGLFLLYF